jgi:hypothetical protein
MANFSFTSDFFLFLKKKLRNVVKNSRAQTALSSNRYCSRENDTVKARHCFRLEFAHFSAIRLRTIGSAGSCIKKIKYSTIFPCRLFD